MHCCTRSTGAFCSKNRIRALLFPVLTFVFCCCNLLHQISPSSPSSQYSSEPNYPPGTAQFYLSYLNTTKLRRHSGQFVERDKNSTHWTCTLSCLGWKRFQSWSPVFYHWDNHREVGISCPYVKWIWEICVYFFCNVIPNCFCFLRFYCFKLIPLSLSGSDFFVMYCIDYLPDFNFLG